MQTTADPESFMRQWSCCPLVAVFRLRWPDLHAGQRRPELQSRVHRFLLSRPGEWRVADDERRRRRFVTRYRVGHHRVR